MKSIPTKGENQRNFGEVGDWFTVPPENFSELILPGPKNRIRIM